MNRINPSELANHHLIDPITLPSPSPLQLTFDSMITRLYPRKSFHLDSMPWTNEEEGVLNDNLKKTYLDQLQSLLIVLSNNNQTLGLYFINLLLKSILPNVSINTNSSNASLQANTSNSTSFEPNIINFIRTNLSSIDSISKTCRCTIAQASIFNSALCPLQKKEILQVRLGLSEKCANKVISDSTSSFQFPNHTQSPSELSKMQVNSILEFCHSDECSRIDSNSNRCVKV